MFSSERHAKYLAPPEMNNNTEVNVRPEPNCPDLSFPEFPANDEDLQQKLQQLMRHRFFHSYTDGRKRRYGLCEISPSERTLIVDALTVKLELHLADMGLS